MPCAGHRLRKRSGAASRMFRQTPPTPCTACCPCTPFSWMPIWSSIPTASSGSRRWPRCRPLRISSTGSSAPRRSANCAIWQKRVGVICPPVTSYTSTTGTPTWGDCRRYASGWTARRVRTIHSRCSSSVSESGRQRTAWCGKPRGYWRVIRKFPCGKPTSRNSMPSCRHWDGLHAFRSESTTAVLTGSCSTNTGFVPAYHQPSNTDRSKKPSASWMPALFA